MDVHFDEPGADSDRVSIAIFGLPLSAKLPDARGHVAVRGLKAGERPDRLPCRLDCLFVGSRKIDRPPIVSRGASSRPAGRA